MGRLDITMKSRLFIRDYIYIIIINILVCTYGQVLLSAIPLYVNSRGFSESVAGIVSSSFALATLFCRPFIGSLSDKLPRKSVVVCGLTSFAILSLLFNYASSISFMILLRSLQGIAMGLISTFLGTIVGDIIPKDRFDEGMGYYGIGVPAMSFLGPAIGFILLVDMGYNVMFILLTILMIVAVTLCLQVRYKKTEEPAGTFEATQEHAGLLQKYIVRSGIYPMLILFLTVVSHSSIVSFLPIYVQRYSIYSITLFYVLAGISIIGIRLIFTIFKPKILDKTLVVIAMLSLVITMLSIRYLASTVLLATVAVLYGLALGIVQPYLISRVMNGCPPNRRGAATATYYLGFDMGFGIGGVLWGAVGQYISYLGVYYFAAGIDLAALILLFRLFRDDVRTIEKDVKAGSVV